jgi:hypothetical protein
MLAVSFKRTTQGIGPRMQPTERARLAGRLAALAAAAAAALVLAAALAQLCPVAQAARADRHALLRSAHLLAGIVRHSARMAGRGRPAGVVTIRCCRRRTLAVYYRSRPRPGLPWHGTYELKLRRRGAFLESVGIAFFPTAASWSYGAAGSREGPRYEFTISAPRRSRGWRLNVSESYFACPPASSVAAQCDGFSDAFSLGERQLGARRLSSLVKQALGVVRKARRRVPISGAEAAAATLR